MSSIIARIDSLSAKVAKLKQIIRTDSKESKTKKKTAAEITESLKSAIAPTKSKKRKDRNDGGTVIRKPITMTIEKKSDGKQIEKAIEKISVKFDAQQDRNNRQSSRDPRKVKTDSDPQKHKQPLALSLQK